MTNQIVPSNTRNALEIAGHAANRAAAQNIFSDYRDRKSQNTLRSQDADLTRFLDYLTAAQVIQPGATLDTVPLNADAETWRGVTWGIVQGFIQWQLNNAYSIASINRALSSVKVYAKMAFKAGAMDAETHALIRTVSGYTRKESKKINEKRTASGIETRTGDKKAEHVSLSIEQADRLKNSHDNTPQGRRDRLLMALLVDLGLRAGEVALITVDNVKMAKDRKSTVLEIYRPKVDKMQTHTPTDDLYDALKAWFDNGDAPAAGKLLRGSRKGGKLTSAGMSERAITGRVKALGEQIGVDGLSAHDCRHYWATYWGQRVEKLPKGVFTLQEAGGWNSLAMPRHYVELAAIANEGMA